MFESNNIISFSPLDYPEPPPAIRGSRDRLDWLRRECRVQQVANRPNPVGDAERHGRRSPQGFVDAAHVLVPDVQAHGRRVVLELFRERIGEPGEPPRAQAVETGHTRYPDYPLRVTMPDSNQDTTNFKLGQKPRN